MNFKVYRIYKGWIFRQVKMKWIITFEEECDAEAYIEARKKFDSHSIFITIKDSTWRD